MILPSAYQWVQKEATPLVLKEAVKLYGTKEIKGGKHNPEIISWAHEVNPSVALYYMSDEIPWCGLFVAVCLRRAGWTPPAGYDALRALSYATWGNFVQPQDYRVGDIAVFQRKGGGHVGFLVGKDDDCYHVLGGNQGDEVSFSRLTKDRLHAVVRPPYKNIKPRYIPTLRPSGGVSENEA